jgi:hypothetical protein
MTLKQWAAWAFESVMGWRWHRRLRRETGEAYMDRWQLLRTKRLSIYINRINLPDADPLPHTHPWEESYSLKFWGSYTEETFRVQMLPTLIGLPPRLLSQGERIPPRWSRIPDIHRIVELTNGKPCWTLFFGVKVAQRWGFVQPDGKLIPAKVRKAQRGVASED